MVEIHSIMHVILPIEDKNKLKLKAMFLVIQQSHSKVLSVLCWVPYSQVIYLFIFFLVAKLFPAHFFWAQLTSDIPGFSSNED